MADMIHYISEDLKLDRIYLENLIAHSAHYYRTYDIKKPDGRLRHISHPSPELKTLQYWCAENIFSLFPVSNAAFAYRKGLSIKKHAEYHVKGKFILHMDIEKFFESITDNHTFELISKNSHLFIDKPFDIVEDVDTINNICLKTGRMCIGSVSSPVISNAVLYDFDNAIIEHCRTHGFKYSRYADDMYISSETYIDSSIIDFFIKELEKKGFRLNKKKTRFMSQKGKRSITGLVITNEKKVSVGLDLRQKIKSMVYNKMIKDEGDPNVIMGYLSFLKDVEPLSYNKIIIKYSKYGNVIEKILS